MSRQRLTGIVGVLLALAAIPPIVELWRRAGLFVYVPQIWIAGVALAAAVGAAGAPWFCLDDSWKEMQQSTRRWSVVIVGTVGLILSEAFFLSVLWYIVCGEGWMR